MGILCGSKPNMKQRWLTNVQTSLKEHRPIFIENKTKKLCPSCNKYKYLNEYRSSGKRRCLTCLSKKPREKKLRVKKQYGPMSINSTTKRCTTCKEIRLASCFGTAAKNQDGLKNICKLCINLKNHSKRVVQRELKPAQIVTAQEWTDKLKAYKYCCAYCGKNGDELVIEHIIPISKGGSHTIDNIVPAHLACNTRKRNRHCIPLRPDQVIN